jgi:hypothetical protein
MAIDIARRELLAALGVAALAGPLAAQGQQPAPGKWRIAMLMPEPRKAPLREGLRELGYIEGQNLAVEWRFNDSVNQLAAFAVELVGLKPDIIATAGTQAAQAAQKATKDIPIVMAASNPLGNGLVRSLAHPGGLRLLLSQLELVRDSREFGDGANLHLPHQVAAMDLDRGFADFNISGNLFAEPAAGNLDHDRAFTRA